MATTPEATKGVPRLEGNSTLTLRADHNALADWVRDQTGRSVANTAALPADGNWIGRTIHTDDYDLTWVCTALPGTWKITNPNSVRALCSAARASFTALGDNDLVALEDPHAMVNAATDTITIPITGTYQVAFNFIQSGTTSCTGVATVNGATAVSVGATGSSGAASSPSAVALLKLTAGDTVKFRSSAATATVFASTSTASVMLVGN